MTKSQIAEFLAVAGLGLLLLAAAGCDGRLEDRIADTIFFGLRIADIWV